MSTFNNSEIFDKVCKSGWVVLVHHFETVTGSRPICLANHRFVLPASANVPLILFSFFIANKLMLDANILKYIEKQTFLNWKFDYCHRI